MSRCFLVARGKEADGIVGDFILRNDLVEAVIAQNAPYRKANMKIFGVLMVRLKVVFSLSLEEATTIRLLFSLRLA